jgi:hypothetical protein
MKYMLLMYANESAGSENQAEEYQAWITYMQEAAAAGVLVDNGGLQPVTSATTVRVRDNQTLTTDGPFAETHEQFGGYSILDCENLDEAIRWASKVPTARFGSVEIRPLWSENQSTEYTSAE